MNKFFQNHTSKNQSVLVVIGYSFPFVNHKYDYELLRRISPFKVYIQNPKFDINEIKNRFFLERVFPISNCDRFYIPNEMYETYEGNNAF